MGAGRCGFFFASEAESCFRVPEPILVAKRLAHTEKFRTREHTHVEIFILPERASPCRGGEAKHSVEESGQEGSTRDDCALRRVLMCGGVPSVAVTRPPAELTR